MKYISTRGQGHSKDFQDVLLAGLADDGGLYVPETLPQFSAEKIRSLKGLPYHQLAFEIIQPFVGGTIEDDKLRQMIDDSYAGFSHQAIAPLHQLSASQWVMELFHGPTLAFKDFALQLLGRLLDHSLTERNEKAIVLGATSGDTGSAAIEGCRHSDRLDIFILHPYQRVSEVQRRQMTTVLDNNVHNIAIQGNFDDCQDMVKRCFADQSFLPENTRLVAVNSINWARIMAQIVYYFHAALALGAPDQPVSFSVPTGNFGDIFAGYIARGMGLPIEKLIVATNNNDILHRFFQNNDYRKQALHQTLSPSMDIMVSSNFERLLFDMHNRRGDAMADLMSGFQKTGNIRVGDSPWQAIREVFDSSRSDDQQVCDTIRTLYNKTGYLADPHTATGIRATEEVLLATQTPAVTLATAHPVKFPDAIVKAGLDAPALPAHIVDLFEREERYEILENDLLSVVAHIKNTSLSS
ncbi:threonine synthase [Endozoicomonas sp. SCSIO W0465]|uniref:threonine synthase n=1 Tax=Endozoicomonas sp. SCSIO W0465 TaxID=2918516 RepID=UPI002076230E|nr:threonine synthase [Endozoicomonas sp. SCSIO W0465]USE39046.1 threonine synthase [Endozoicomonas sp. SCSIO W0465]